MVAAAAINNREPPAELRGYGARVETELSLIIRDTLGRERAAQIEQLAAAAGWRRSGLYDLHVVGYRSQSVGVPYSALSIVRGWTIPSLYGDRLRLGATFGRTSSSEARNQIVAVHPFASDRDAYYGFEGGDTITVLRAGDRSIPIARVRVTPRSSNGRQLGLFDGEIDLDATRHQIVRMRGQFVVFGERPRRCGGVRRVRERRAPRPVLASSVSAHRVSGKRRAARPDAVGVSTRLAVRGLRRGHGFGGHYHDST
jgi:hypothetical protein